MLCVLRLILQNKSSMKGLGVDFMLRFLALEPNGLSLTYISSLLEEVRLPSAGGLRNASCPTWGTAKSWPQSKVLT